MHQKVQWKGDAECPADLQYLVDTIASEVFHDQEIHVRVRVRRSVSVGAEQNNLPRLELGSDRICEMNDRLGSYHLALYSILSAHLGPFHTKTNADVVNV